MKKTDLEEIATLPLPVIDRAILAMLRARANKNEVRITNLAIAAAIGRRRRAVQYSIKRLVEKGYLDRSGGRGQGVANLYVIHIPPVAREEEKHGQHAG